MPHVDMSKSEHRFLHNSATVQITIIKQCHMWTCLRASTASFIKCNSANNPHETMPHVDISKSEHRFLHNSATVQITAEYELFLTGQTTHVKNTTYNLTTLRRRMYRTRE